MLSIHEFRQKYTIGANFFSEAFATEEQLERHQPKNAQWQNIKSDSATYYFDVEGDDCDGSIPYGDPTCYKVRFSGDSRNVESGISIAFFRRNKIDDVDRGFGTDVFNGVLKGIQEYIKANKPYSVNWSPVYKSAPRGEKKIDNPQARKKVYELWARQTLFPKYVSYRENHWVRKDIYDKYFTADYLGSHKFPEISNEIRSIERKEAIEKIRQHAGKNLYQVRYLIQSKMQEDQKIEEREKLKEKLNSPEFNPQSIRSNDLVAFKKIEEDRESGATIDYLSQSTALKRALSRLNHHLNDSDINDMIYGQVLPMESTDEEPNSEDAYFIDDNGNRVSSERAKHIIVKVKIYRKFSTPIVAKAPLNELSKISESEVETRKQNAEVALREKLNDRTLNPKEFKVGDKVLLARPYADDFQYESPENASSMRLQGAAMSAKYLGSVGEITNISYNHETRFSNSSLQAEVRLIPEESLEPNFVSTYERTYIVNLLTDRLHKFTDENKRKYLAAKEAAEREKIIQARRSRLERAAARDQERAELGRRASDPEMQELIDHPSNPSHVKPGDRIKILTEDEARQRGISRGYSIRNAGREAVVVSLRKYFLFNVTTPGEVPFKVVVEYKVVRSTIQAGIDATLVEKITDERIERLQQRASARAQARQGIVGGSATGGRQIGDMATVATGPHAGKKGHILGWRTSGAYTYAKIRTEATPSAPSEDIQVNVNLLEPVPGVPTSEQNNPYSFENFLLWRNGL